MAIFTKRLHVISFLFQKWFYWQFPDLILFVRNERIRFCYKKHKLLLFYDCQDGQHDIICSPSEKYYSSYMLHVMLQDLQDTHWNFYI